MNYLIYSVEDDSNIGRIINISLSKQGFNIRTFANGKDFYDAFNKEVPNLILLDMMLPDMSGKDILKFVRSNKAFRDVSIIIISANSMTIDKVDGLDLGADDYIAKPFDILELISRVNVQYRRYLEKEEKITIRNLSIEPNKMEVRRDGQLIYLTKKEFDVLMMLINAKGNVVTRENILNKLWGLNAELESRTVDMHVKALRKKLSEDLIMTVYGTGYKVML